MESEFFFRKKIHLFSKDSSVVDTIDHVTFDEKCYISLKIDSTILPSVLFDTGSDRSLFDINIVNYERMGREDSIINVWGEKIPIKYIYIDTMVLGKTKYIPKNKPFGDYMRSQSIIGGDVLTHFVWKIDNLRRKIYFSQDMTAFLHSDCSAVPFVMNRNTPFIKCIVNGREYSVMIDTGYAGFLHIVDETEVNTQFTLLQEESRDSFFCTVSIFDDMYSIGNYGLSGNLKRFCKTISDIKINDLSFNDEIVDHNVYQNNLLGWDFIQRFEYVILDYINQVLYLGPINEFKSFSYMRDLRGFVNSTGIMSSFSSEQVIISLTDSLKEKGLSLGDTIIAIDGENVTTFEMLKVIYSRESAVITVKNENSEKDYTLHRKRFITEPDTVMTFGEISLIPLYRNMFISHPVSSGGRIVKYYNWKPPFIIGDLVKVFD